MENLNLIKKKSPSWQGILNLSFINWSFCVFKGAMTFMMLIVKCPGREKTFKFINIPFMSQRGELRSLLINEQVSANEAVKMAKVTALCQVLHKALHISCFLSLLQYWHIGIFHLLGCIWKGRHREIMLPSLHRCRIKRLVNLDPESRLST